MADQGLIDAIEKAIEGLDREYPWMGGAAIVVDEDGDFDAIPGAYLNDISYTGSRDVVVLYNDIYELVGDEDPDEIDATEVARFNAEYIEQ